MKILVIGGTRFFGKRFVATALKNKHEVTLITRGLTADPFGAEVLRLKADRTQREAFLNAVKGKSFDVVLDQTCMTAQDASIAIESLSGRIGHYVMTSTLSVYPQKPDLKESDLNTEKYVPAPATNPAEQYSQGKQAAEQKFLLQNHFSVSIARIPIIVGPDDYTKRLYKHIEFAKNEKELYFPNLKAKFSYLSSEDAAAALTWLAENQKSGVYNFSAPDQWTMNELVSELEKCAKKKVKLAEQATDENHSPFGISEDYYMNVSKAASEGFKVKALADWLPQLMQKLADEIK